ncbi:3D domain-containing protein, partial [Peptoniphilus grossensis]
IKGNRIDLFYNSNAEANRFGRRNVKVYVLD